jgi:ribonuclease HI
MGAILFGPRGTLEITYSWNLGRVTNNQAKAYALLQGLSLVGARNVHKLVVLRDSKNTIRHLKPGSLTWDARLCSIFRRIQIALHAFS